MVTVSLILEIIGTILIFLRAFGVSWPRPSIDLGWLGVGLWCVAILLPNIRS